MNSVTEKIKIFNYLPASPPAAWHDTRSIYLPYLNLLT
jgi:hypothetical protein